MERLVIAGMAVSKGLKMREKLPFGGSRPKASHPNCPPDFSEG
jgi:hypothetical protein